MTKELRGLDLKRAQLVPSSVFAGPDEVVAHAGLSAAQKLAILRRWEFDARRVAGFAGASGRDTGLLLRVRRAIHMLTAAVPSGRDYEITPSRLPSGGLAAEGATFVLEDGEPAPPHPLFAGEPAAPDEKPPVRGIRRELR